MTGTTRSGGPANSRERCSRLAPCVPVDEHELVDVIDLQSSQGDGAFGERGLQEVDLGIDLTQRPVEDGDERAIRPAISDQQVRQLSRHVAVPNSSANCGDSPRTGLPPMKSARACCD